MLTLCALFCTLLSISAAQEQLHHYAAEPQLHFLIIGDHGDINNETNADINFDGMNKFVRDQAQHYEFFVGLGDNIYDNGMDSIHDPSFTAMIDLFASRQYLKDIPIYPVLGNHDCRGSVDAQVQVSELDNSWEMPSLYYSRSYDIDPKREGDELGLLFLNGCMLCCISDAASVFCDEMSQHHTDEVILQHYKWLDQELTRMTENNILFTALLIHYPIYSSTDTEWNQESMVKYVLPLIRKHKVNLLFTGHSHNFQYHSLDLDQYSQAKVMHLYHEKLEIGECVKEHGQFRPDPSRHITATLGNTLHSFVIGASGKHGLQSICADYADRLIGTLHYAHNTNPSFAAAHVIKDAFSIDYYAVNEEREYIKLYEFTLLASPPSTPPTQPLL